MKIFQMKRILGAGNALVDVMTMIDNDQVLEKFSLPKGSMQLVDSRKSEFIKNETKHFSRILSSGGSAANTIHGLAMLGAETGFIGSVGRDDTGDIFENDMKKAGVNTTLLRRDTSTGTAVALIAPDTERTFATHLGAAVELNADDLRPEMFEGYDILYLEGYLINNMSLTETACKMAKKSGMQIALDLASFNVVAENRESFRKILSGYTDIVFANAGEATTFTDLPPVKALTELSELCEIAVVKTGKEGSMIKCAGEIIRINALPVKCRDTTGAGDLYAAGFLYGYAGENNLEICGLLGAYLAGRVIETVGARIEDNLWEEIRRYARGIILK